MPKEASTLGISFRRQIYELFPTFKTETQKKERYVHREKNRKPKTHRHNRMA